MTDLCAELQQFRPLLYAVTAEELRFFSKVRERTSGCWEWIGSRQRGYGQFSHCGRPQPAHRVAFKWFYGEAELGRLHIDHLCRNRACVNPLHLEAVTQAENNRRAHKGRPKPRRSSCRRGHRLDADNSGVRADGKGVYCRECSRASWRRCATKRNEVVA